MIGTIEELRGLINDVTMGRPHLTGRLEKAEAWMEPSRQAFCAARYDLRTRIEGFPRWM